ncbi:GlxA family transcriptional regulator [Pseudomonas aeruginosa]|uniref:GlxA family transcriptional regulator n=1 Tax=Pseudomonas aeruginosa TaxID=287 RepID=UPI003CC6B6F4
MPEPRLIACLIYPDVMSLDVTGPLQVFASANVERQRQGLPPFYRIQVLGERSEAVPSSAGIRICADLAWRDCPPESLDTLLVPGGLGVEAQTRNADLLAWLKAAEPCIRRLGSVCSGALILAAAGVLDGRPATTHWADVATLRQGFPGIHVQGDRLHTYDPRCRDGDAHIFTSAGVTAGIDLALALVEADLGRSLALSVARRLVMFLKRPGDLSLEALADQACMSPRTLSRVFLQELGVAPGRYVERVRLEAARALLQDAQASIATVSRLCGFGHPENLRRTFHKHLSVSPQEYAERFGMLA